MEIFHIFFTKQKVILSMHLQSMENKHIYKFLKTLPNVESNYWDSNLSFSVIVFEDYLHYP